MKHAVSSVEFDLIAGKAEKITFSLVIKKRNSFLSLLLKL